MRSAARRAAAIFASVVVISACAPTVPPKAAPAVEHGGASSAATTAPVMGGRVVVGAFADAKVLNPVLSSDVPSAEVWGRIYESLIGVDPRTAQPRPRLAERFEHSADSRP